MPVSSESKDSTVHKRNLGDTVLVTHYLGSADTLHRTQNPRVEVPV
jgi:hypothetical protein